MEQQALPQTEIERIFLAKHFPAGMSSYKFIDIVDLYVPFSVPEPKIRIRKYGTTYTLTKKMPINEYDKSVQLEQTISLTQEEYDELATVNGKRLAKRRYFVPVSEKIANLDYFLGDLKGLVLVTFAFPTQAERDNFAAPDFCGAEVTQVTGFSGRFLAGKDYKHIAPFLEEYSYTKVADW